MNCILYNVGNTCYINTAFQCLLNTTSFKNFVCKYGNSETSTLLYNIKIYIDTNQDMSTSERIHAWKHIMSLLEHKFKSKMFLYTQNDLCEFVLLFIDEMIKNSLKPLTSTEIIRFKSHLETYTDENIINTGTSFGRLCLKKWIGLHKKEYSDIIPIFNSLLVSQIKCGRCNKLHTNFENSLCIQLDITNHSSIQTSLEEYMRTIHFNTNDTQNIEWTCDKCKNKQRSKRVTIFVTLGDVVLIFLKRFSYDMGGRTIKINKPIQYSEILEMNKLLFDKPAKFTYILKAVGCHIGIANNGHYCSLIHNDDNKWILIDDEMERPINDHKSFIESHGYMFIYQKTV